MKIFLKFFKSNPIISSIAVFVFSSVLSRLFFNDKKDNDFKKITNSFSLNYSLGLTKKQALKYSSSLHDYMKDGGTEEVQIKSIFLKMNSKGDFKKVYKEFGVQKYSVNGSPSWLDLYIGLYTKHDLTGWLVAEIDTISDYQTYNLVKKVAERDGFTI